MQTLFNDVILNPNGDLSNEAFHRFGCSSRYGIQKGMRGGDGEIRGLKLSTAPELTQTALAYDLKCARPPVTQPLSMLSSSWMRMGFER
jgi:hypothetical protein